MDKEIDYICGKCSAIIYKTRINAFQISHRCKPEGESENNHAGYNTPIEIKVSRQIIQEYPDLENIPKHLLDSARETMQNRMREAMAESFFHIMFGVDLATPSSSETVITRIEGKAQLTAGLAELSPKPNDDENE